MCCDSTEVGGSPARPGVGGRGSDFPARGSYFPHTARSDAHPPSIIAAWNGVVTQCHHKPLENVLKRGFKVERIRPRPAQPSRVRGSTAATARLANLCPHLPCLRPYPRLSRLGIGLAVGSDSGPIRHVLVCADAIPSLVLLKFFITISHASRFVSRGQASTFL